MDMARYVVVSNMSCWTIVEHVHGVITLILNWGGAGGSVGCALEVKL